MRSFVSGFLLFLTSTLHSTSFAQTQSSPLTLISDIDDTLLQTNVENKWKAATSILHAPRVFIGMNFLFQEFKKTNDDHEFNYVSGSGKFLTLRLTRFLDRFQFPEGHLFLTKNKDWLKHNISSFKTNTISNLLQQNKNPALLFGDNTEMDPEIYLNLKAKFSNQISQIYIHKISLKHTNLESTELFYYLTPVEIAIHEYEMGRLTKENVLLTFDFFMNSINLNFDLTFPKWGFCPADVHDFPDFYSENHSEFETQLETIRSKIISNCSLRKSKSRSL